jgi:hypothetical protein
LMLINLLNSGSGTVHGIWGNQIYLSDEREEALYCRKPLLNLP